MQIIPSKKSSSWNTVEHGKRVPIMSYIIYHDQISNCDIQPCHTMVECSTAKPWSTFVLQHFYQRNVPPYAFAHALTKSIWKPARYQWYHQGTSDCMSYCRARFTVARHIPSQSFGLLSI